MVVPKSVKLYWDTKSMNSEVFFIAARVVLTCGTSRLTLQLPESSSRLFLQSMHLISVVDNLRECWHLRSPLNIKHVLRKIRHAQSSDPRDRIYAISGLVPEEYQIVPDYTNTTVSVYYQTTLSIISTDRSLDVLSLCGHPQVASDLVLPSWCPNWSTRSKSSRQPLIVEEVPVGVEPRNSWINASKGLVA
jgi:hypothetical protein